MKPTPETGFLDRVRSESSYSTARFLLSLLAFAAGTLGLICALCAMVLLLKGNGGADLASAFTMLMCGGATAVGMLVASRVGVALVDAADCVVRREMRESSAARAW